MKRIAWATLAGLIAGAIWAAIDYGSARAAPDADPWENVTNRKKFTRPTEFDQDVFFVFIDGGTGWFQTMHTTTSVVDGTERVGLVDAGDELVNGQMQVGGPAMLSGKNRGSCVLDGGSPAQCDVTGIDARFTSCGCFADGSTATEAIAVAAHLSSTTLTCTAANGKAITVKGHCF